MHVDREADGAAGRPPMWSVLDAPRGLWWGVFLLIWTLQVGLYAFATYYVQRGSANPLSPADALVTAAYDWYLWALVCLLCFGIASRLPLERYSTAFLLPALAVAAAVVTLARGVVDHLASLVFGWPPFPLLDRLIQTLPGRYIFVLSFFLIGYGIDYIRRHRERERKAMLLREQLASAQLHMLKVQLHPHFLFNTLHAISSLMYIDVAAADRMLLRLSDLLRRTLQMMDAQKVTLAEEITFLEPYLEIEQTRLAHRLNVEMRIAPGTLPALVPHLVLQPLVENAVRHGIFPKLGGGTLLLETAIVQQRLVLVVEDDGVGLPEGSSDGAVGVGLANTRQRLDQLYGGSFRLTVEDRSSGGVRVQIEIPLELSELPPPYAAEVPHEIVDDAEVMT